MNTSPSPSATSPSRDVNTPDSEGLRATRRWLLWSGIGLLVVGIAAVAFPFLATLVTTAFIGWLLLIAGVAAMVRAFSNGHSGVRFGSLALGILRVLVGGYLVLNPLAGAFVLTIVIAALFIFDGAMGIFGAFALKPMPGWGWVLASGIVGVLAGLLIASGFPGASLVLLGTIVGISFIFDGVACLARYGALGR